MAYLIMGLQGLLSIGALICFIMVVIQMFQRGSTGLGVLCIVLFFCFLGGLLLAFIIGWVKATEWNIKNLMLAWTGLIVVSLILSAISAAMGVAAFPGLPAS